MLSRTDRFRKIPPEWDLWQKLYYKHQRAYIRQRLLALKYLWEGKSRAEVSQILGCTYLTLTKWIDKFLEGGLVKLTEPITHKVPSRLNEEQKLELKRMLLEQKPFILWNRQIYLDGKNYEESDSPKMGSRT